MVSANLLFWGFLASLREGTCGAGRRERPPRRIGMPPGATIGYVRRPMNSQRVSEDVCSHPLTICSHLQMELLANMGGLGVSCEQPVEGVNDTRLRLGTRNS